MALTIRGLSKMLKTMRILCGVIRTYGPKIREFVPPANQAAYDTALSQITTACDVIDAIDWIADGIGSN